MDRTAAMSEIAKYIGDWRRSKRFFTPTGIDSQQERDLMLGKLMLVVTEAAEAAEAVRHADMKNFAEELADTFIRLFDICEAIGVDPAEIVLEKMKVNEGREVLHGKKCSI